MANYLDLSGLQTYHNKLKTYIGGLHDAIEEEIAKKQDKLTAGNGISIDPQTNVISFSGDATIFLFVDELPALEDALLNKVYVVQSAKTETGNVYTEWYVKVTGEERAWEKLGEFKEDIDLTNYYTKSEAEAMVDGKLASYALADNVYDKTTADGRFVKQVDFITTGQIDNIFA